METAGARGAALARVWQALGRGAVGLVAGGSLPMAVRAPSALPMPELAGLLPGIGFGILIPVTVGLSWALDRDLFAEIAEGTFVWRDKTPAELAEGQERRKRLFRDSHVPWIVSDLGVLLQAYDDIQDVVAFARWNKRLLVGSELKKCIGRCVGAGQRSAVDCFMRCSCPFSAGGKRLAQDAVNGWGESGLLHQGFFDKLAGFKGPFMYALLAGQVSYSLFGVGIRLGPIMGAAMELAFRGLAAVGLPFGPEHNKYNQLKRARVLQQADRIFGSLSEMPPGERTRALIALREAYAGVRDLSSPPWTPGQTGVISQGVNDALSALGRGDVGYFTSKDGFIDDAFNVMKQAYEMGASLPGNLASYLGGDILGDTMQHLGAVAQGADWAPGDDLTKLQKAMFRFQHASQCPGGHCPGVTEEGLYVQEWAEGRKRRGHRPERFPPLANRLAGGSFSAGALPGL